MSKPTGHQPRDSFVNVDDDDFNILQIVQMRLQGNAFASQMFVLPRQERHVHGNNQTDPCSLTTTSPTPTTPSVAKSNDVVNKQRDTFEAKGGPKCLELVEIRHTSRPEIQQDATTLLAECQKKELEPEPEPDRTVTQPPRPRIPGAYAVEGLGTGDEVEDATEAGENGDDVVAHPVNEDNDLQSGELQNAEPLIFSRRTRIYWRQRLVLLLSLQATVALAVIVVILLVILMVSLPRKKAINQSASQQDGAFQISTSSGVASQSPKKFLVSVNLPDNTMQAMERPQSPQSKAYQWLIKNLNNQSSSLQQLPDWRLVQRFPLATFYYSTRGDHWVKHHGWLDWDTNECDWELIFLWGKVDSPELHCNDKGEITGLEFGHTNNLEGTLPPEISLLGNSLQALGFLREFQLEGTIPTEVGLLTKLTRLELGAAALSGTVPTEFGCLQSLEQLVMSSIAGSLPSELGNLGNLQSGQYRPNRIPPC